MQSWTPPQKTLTTALENYKLSALKLSVGKSDLLDFANFSILDFSNLSTIFCSRLLWI